MIGVYKYLAGLGLQSLLLPPLICASRYIPLFHWVACQKEAFLIHPPRPGISKNQSCRSGSGTSISSESGSGSFFDKKLQFTEKPSALKREHPTLQKMKFNFFLWLWVIFALLGPDPNPQHWQKPRTVKIGTMKRLFHYPSGTLKIKQLLITHTDIKRKLFFLVCRFTIKTIKPWEQNHSRNLRTHKSKFFKANKQNVHRLL